MNVGSGCRSQFPLLTLRPEVVYLDAAATSLKPKQVIDAQLAYLTRYSANVHRGVYGIAEEATEAYEHARRNVALFIGASSPEEIVFAKNTTEAINLVAYAWGRLNFNAGDEIVVSIAEHHSNFVPWQQLASAVGATLKVVEVDEGGTLAWGNEILTERTKLVALAHVSNVLGTINPIEEITRAAHEIGALMLVDGAQAVGHFPVDVQKLDVDFYAFSGHKMYGPTGVGVLYGKRKHLETMPPFLYGGSMIEEVQLKTTTFAKPPRKFEAGTPPIAEVIGLSAAVDFLQSIDMKTVRAHEETLTAHALEALAQANVRLFGPSQACERGGLISWEVPGVHAHDVAQVLAAHGIAVRAGHHCTMPLHTYLGIPATTRASFSVFTTKRDISHLIAALTQAQQLLKLPEKESG